MHSKRLAVILFVSVFGGRLVPGASDFQWVLNNDAFNTHYILTSVSSPKVFAGTLPADNPTINLILGQRYGVTNTNFGSHPFQVIAAGPPDTVLLAQGVAAGSLEADPTIQWSDAGAGLVEFTLSQSLVDALTTTGLTPGYRCQIHTSLMRGNFALFGTGTEIVNPIPARIAFGTEKIELKTVLEGLVSPLAVVQPDDGTNRLFIHDQAGKVWIVENGVPVGVPFLDVSARLVALMSAYDERGLLGFAMHPNFSATPKVYTYTSEPVAGAADFTTPVPAVADHQSVIAEWTVDGGNPNRIDPASRRELLRIDKPEFNHNAGALRFGSDGYLYFSLGDGGQGDDQGPGHLPDGNAQDTGNVYGKIMRIDVAGSNSANGHYGIPPTNPFVGVAGVDEIWAYGLRNPYSMTFDTATEVLWVADAGQNKVEEVDNITSGGNYGWRLKEGSFYFDPNGAGDGFVTTVPVLPLPSGLIDPVAEYDHDDGVVVVGGFVYHGTTIPGLAGRYVMGDFGTSFSVPSGRLFYIDGSGQIVEFHIGAVDRPLGLWLKGFGQDRRGDVYVCGSGMLGPAGTTGKVLKIVPVPTSAGHWDRY